MRALELFPFAPCRSDVTHHGLRAGLRGEIDLPRVPEPLQELWGSPMT